MATLLRQAVSSGSDESRVAQGRKGRGHDSAGLVAGGAHGGLVFLQNIAGKDGDEDAGFGLALGEDLIAEAGVFHVKGNHFAQPETEHRDRFAGACGDSVEVEYEDAHRCIGNDDGDEAATWRDAAQGVANRQGYRSGDVI